MDVIINPSRGVSGEITVPGDKSVSHRAVMLGSIASGTTRITNFLAGEDCLATIDCFRRLGVKIEHSGTDVTIFGSGGTGLKEYGGTLYTANSGTTTRLISGILAGQPFQSTVSGDASIQKRPMNRIILPLTQMGAKITSQNGFCPMTIGGGNLKGIDYTLPVASAQLKSCILLAGLYAEGETTVREKTPSRNHTELMLKAFGAKVSECGGTVTVSPSRLTAAEVRVPSDISSAAFFMVLGLISPKDGLLIKNVGINPTRTGIIEALKAMGGHIELINKREGAEPAADIYVKASKLKGADIGGEIIPSLIDEIPVLAVAAAYAEGKTTISGAGELKFKETDRIAAICNELSKCGAVFIPTEDGMTIEGAGSIKGAKYNSLGDHRIAMAAAVAAAFADSPSVIYGAECAAVSYPNFFEDIKKLI